jgi:hypothetical protein
MDIVNGTLDNKTKTIVNKEQITNKKSYGFYLDFWKKNKVAENGELQLEDGRTLGHKD